MWLEEDQDKVVAWLRARHEICQQCGTAESDWMDPVTKRWLDVPKWEPVTFRCPGCAELERAREMIPKGSGSGVRVVLVPLDPDREDDEEPELHMPRPPDSDDEEVTPNAALWG